MCSPTPAPTWTRAHQLRTLAKWLLTCSRDYRREYLDKTEARAGKPARMELEREIRREWDGRR